MTEMTISEALRLGIEAHKAGRIKEADRYYTAILGSSPEHPDANHNLGVLAVGIGQVERSLPYFKKALEQNKSILQFWVSLADAYLKLKKYNDARDVLNGARASGLSGKVLDELTRKLSDVNVDLQRHPLPEDLDGIINLYNTGEFEKALEKATNLIKSSEQPLILHNVCGAANAALKRYDAAIENYKSAIDLNPNYADAFNNMGIAQQENNDLDGAISSYNKAIEIKPNFAEAFNNLGNLYRIIGNYDEAHRCGQKAIHLKPDYPEAYNNLGNTFFDLSKNDDAVSAYKKALQLNPAYPEAYINLGNVSQKLTDFDEAISLYRKAIAINVNCQEAYVCLAEALDRRNLIRELSACVSDAKKRFNPTPPEVQLMLVLSFFRDKKFQHASAALAKVKPDDLSLKRKVLFYQLSGRISESNKKFSAAFTAFNKMNELIRSDKIFESISKNEFTEGKTQLCKDITNLSTYQKPGATNMDLAHDAKITFLVGFPRSGTTLIDVILRSHPEVIVVEEEPAIEAVKEYYNNHGKYDFVSVNPPEYLRKTALQIYFDKLGVEKEKDVGNSLLVDKLPLNLFELPLINYLFPRAKFILAIRHPLDAILSCWKQVFEPNLAMVNMTSIGEIINLFIVANKFLLICEEKLNLKIHRIRYEHLIEDRNKALKKLLSFLDLAWHENLMSHQDTAKNLNKMKTPSYHQVTQPIYQESMYSWLNYRSQIKEYLQVIEPEILRLGYQMK